MLGNEKLISQLKSAAMEDRLAHAYLLVGAAGSGKKTLAGMMSRLILCEQGGCGECTACRKLALSAHPDLIEVRGVNKNGAYSVDQIRSLRKDALVYPNEGRKKIYILHEAEKMRAEAQDAFLKILEEPPAFVVFLLLCGDESKLLATIHSRVIRLSLELPETSVSLAWLREKTGKSDADLRRALGVAGGNPGQALELVQEGTLEKRAALCEKIMETLLCDTPYALSAMSHALAADKAEFAAVLKTLMLYLRDILVYKTTGDLKEIIFAEEISRNSHLYVRLRTQGIPDVITKLSQLALYATQPISILMIEMRFVTLLKEELL